MFSDMLRQQHWRMKFRPVWRARSYPIIQSKVNLKLEVCNTDNDLIDHLFTKKLWKKLINKRCYQKAKTCYKKAKKYIFFMLDHSKKLFITLLYCASKNYFSVLLQRQMNIYFSLIIYPIQCHWSLSIHLISWCFQGLQKEDREQYCETS